MKALIIDASIDTAEMFAYLLRHCGHEVHTADEPQAALDIARTQKPDIIFLDIGLPAMDGYTLAQKLRNEPAIDGVKIVALSGRMVDEARFKESGIDKFLLKPVGVKTLKEVIGC